MHAHDMPRRLVDTTHAAQLLGTTARHVRELRARRELPVVLVGRLVRYDVTDLLAYIDARRSPAQNGPLACDSEGMES